MTLRSILPVLAINMCCQYATAQSYLYIQGDKQTPIYVKINGVMQERYGKNYCIATNLKPGKVNVEILFQQNKYPPAAFVLDIADSSRNGYIVSRDNGTVHLYNLLTHHTITAQPTDNENK